MKPVIQPFPMRGRRRAQTWAYDPQVRCPRHFHPESELNLVLRGQGCFVIGDQQVHVSAGSVLRFPAGMDHALVRCSPDLEFFVIAYKPSLLDAFHREHGEVPDFARLPEQLDLELLQRSTEPLRREAVYSALDIERHLIALLRAVTTDSAAPSSLGMRASTLIASSPGLGRAQLARTLASNKGDVSRAFRREMGVTLREFRRRLRIIELLARVDDGASSLSQAAALAGFGSYSQCQRIFREVLGMSPRMFFSGTAREEMAHRIESINYAKGLASLPSQGAPNSDALDDLRNALVQGKIES